MNTGIVELPESVRRQARRAYAALYHRALPHAGPIAPERIEVAALNRAATWAEFQKVGLGLETVVIHREADGSGHTGKVLMNLPWQLLLEHRHVDTIVLKRGAPVPRGFRLLRDLVRNFHGIRRYAPDGTPLLRDGRPVYAFPDRDFVIIQAAGDQRPLPLSVRRHMAAVFPGKSETFKAIYGDGVLLHRGARVLHAPPGVRTDRLPPAFRKAVERVRREEVITTEDFIYMGPGVEVLLAGNTLHAFLAGERGAVYLEFSAPSMDEADRFTDPRVIR